MTWVGLISRSKSQNIQVPKSEIKQVVIIIIEDDKKYPINYPEHITSLNTIKGLIYILSYVRMQTQPRIYVITGIPNITQLKHRINK